LATPLGAINNAGRKKDNVEENILVVDDNKDLRELADAILKMQGYQVLLAENGKEALEIFETEHVDLIVSDIAMPEMDGFGLLEEVRSRESGAAIPFLFLSAYSQKTKQAQARRLAVDDYLFKPFDAKELLDAVRVRIDRRRAVQAFDTREAHFQTVMLMANIIEMRDEETRHHIDRVREIALIFGDALDWDKQAKVVLEFGAILHDIGKLIVPKHILNKDGEFTPEEWEIMREHPEAGAKMLEGIDHLKPAIPFVLYHHERWDGNGYPHGLVGEQIPLEGRIMAIVDAYDALRSKRPYQNGISKEEAIERIHEGSRVHFDPYLVRKFMEITDKLP
jgi:putative two-component system response regulator